MNPYKIDPRVIQRESVTLDKSLVKSYSTTKDIELVSSISRKLYANVTNRLFGS